VTEPGPGPLFDSHCHLTAEAFAGDIETVLARAREAGLVGIVTVASHADDAEAALLLSREQPDVWCTAGVHPHEAAGGIEQLPRIEHLAGEARVVAIGETGLDYHYDHSPRRVQRDLFEAQIELAARTGRPLIVHSRAAEADTIAAVRNAAGRGVRGVLHCFTGGRDLLDVALEIDWYVSYAGIVTFRRFDGADLVRAVPPDRLLIETDSPYLAPVPLRGRRNEPANVVHTCAALAGFRGVDPSELGRETTANARRFYRLGHAVAPQP
jgi:TatD DNase family protein